MSEFQSFLMDVQSVTASSHIVSKKIPLSGYFKETGYVADMI